MIGTVVTIKKRKFTVTQVIPAEKLSRTTYILKGVRGATYLACYVPRTDKFVIVA